MITKSCGVVKIPKPLNLKTATDEEVFNAMKNSPDFISKMLNSISKDLKDYILSEDFTQDGVFVVPFHIYDEIYAGKLTDFIKSNKVNHIKYGLECLMDGKKYLAVRLVIIYVDTDETKTLEERGIILNKECFERYKIAINGTKIV